MFTIKELNLYNHKDKQSFLKLMSVCLTPNTLDWIEWKYIKNPAVRDRKILVFGAFDNSTGEIVGIRPLMPIDLTFNQNRIRAAQPCDSAVHPNFQRQGLFSKMNKYAIKVALEEGIQLFFNFPNANSESSYLKLGWQIVSEVDEAYLFNNFQKVVEGKTNNKLYSLGARVLSCTIRNMNLSMKALKNKSQWVENLSIEKETHFTDEFNKLSNDKNIFCYKVFKDKNYLNWRFNQRPDQSYEIWTARSNSKLLGYFVTCTSERWGSKEGQVVDYQYQSENVFFELLIAVMNDFLKKERIEFLSIMCFTEKEIAEKLYSTGFINRSSFPLKYATPKRNLLVKILDETLKNDVYDIQNWSLRSADRDTY